MLSPKDVIDMCLAAFEGQNLDLGVRTARIIALLKYNGYEIVRTEKKDAP